jgi:hypothetical protein
MLLTWEGVVILITVATAIIGLHFKIERRLARLEAKLELLCMHITGRSRQTDEPR